MYLDDKLWKQVNVYYNINSMIDKYRYVDDVIYYYDTHEYESIQRNWCYRYWKSVRIELDFYF
jgi:hypothetical protein